MNKTNLSHWHVTIKIFLAMKQAVKTGITQYVLNKNGSPFLRVTYTRNKVGAFTFFDKSQKDVTNLVLSVLCTVEHV
jgi:lipoprotein signal peptidase